MRLFLALLFLSFSSSAQIELSGYIRDAHGQPLPSANVYLRQKGHEAIEGFAISAANGQYSVRLKLNQADTLLLSVSKIGYQPLERTVVYATQQLDFVLQKGDTPLREVVVKPPAVRRYGDTLSYNVSDFQVESDRSIGDVIARMPGISMDENGRIKYQGKTINRYYIDNLNLLDNRYGLVNNNLPYDKVLSVEVFENHQPIRILDSLVMSETAALNIRLKNKITRTGMLHYGIGASPALWDLNLTPMVFVPNFQFLGSFQSNNIGKNIRTQFSDRLNDAGTPSRDWLRIPGLPAPRFASGRWMDNTSHTGSLNVLTKSEKELELKLNTSLVLDKQERHGNKSMEYLWSNERITYRESTDNFFQKNEFSASLQAIKNTRKTYLKNVLSMDREWLTNEGNNLRTAQQFKQAHTSGNLNLQNSFQNIFIRNGLKYNLYSNADYYQGRQSLSVQYTGTDSLAHPVQDFHLRDFHLHNYLDLSKKIGRITLSGRIGSEISISNVESRLTAHTVQHSTVNDFAWNSYKNYLSLNSSFQKNHWRFSLITPLSLNHIVYRDRRLSTTDRFNKLLLEPTLVARFKPKTSTEFLGNIGYKNALARLGDIYSGYVMTDYLNVIQKNAGFRNNHNYLANLSVNHNDALSGITFSTRYTYSRMVQNVLAETRLNADGSKQVNYAEKTNFNNSHSLATDFSKYLFNLKTSARLGLNYTLMGSQQMINEVFDTYTYQVFTPSAGFSFNHLRWMDFYYNYALTLNKNRNNKSQALQHDQKASLGLSTFKNTYLKFTFEHYRLQSEGNTRNFSFGDILVRYTFPKIKQDLELGLNNVLNQHQFYSITVTDISVQQTTFQLRPRQIILRGRLRF